MCITLREGVREREGEGGGWKVGVRREAKDREGVRVEEIS